MGKQKKRKTREEEKKKPRERKNKKISFLSRFSLSRTYGLRIIYFNQSTYGYTNEISFYICVHSGERERREKRERERETERDRQIAPKKSVVFFLSSFVVVAEWWWWCLQRGRGRERERERECCFDSFFLSLRAQVLDTRWSSALVLHRF